MQRTGWPRGAASLLVISVALASTGCPAAPPAPAPPASVASAAPDTALPPGAPAASAPAPTPSASAPRSAPSPPATGSKGSPYPPVEAACANDADCEIIGSFREGGVGCCTKCGEYVAGTRAWVERARAACRARGPCDLPGSCLEGTTPMFVAKCSAGRCTVKNKTP